MTVEKEGISGDEVGKATDQALDAVSLNEGLKKLVLQSEAAPQPMHVTGGEGVEDVTGDGPERRLRGHADERQPDGFCLVDHGLWDLVYVRGDRDRHADRTCPLEKTNEVRSRLGIRLERRPGREQQTRRHHPRSGVVKVADVHGLDTKAGVPRPGEQRQLQARRLHQLTDREHLAGCAVVHT